MKNQEKALTREEVERDRSDMLLLLASLRNLPHEGKLYLAGFASGIAQAFPCVQSPPG